MSDSAYTREDAPTLLREDSRLLALWSRRFRRPLLSFFSRRTPSGADNEDLVQEVFLRLAKRERLSEIERVDSYLFQTAANVLGDWRRKQTTHSAGAHDPISEAVPEVAASPERVLIDKDELERLIAALAFLPEKTRMIFTLYHFEGLMHSEIARQLGVAVRTVENHIARANVHLNTFVDRR